jgi:glycerate dehydrogenase
VRAGAWRESGEFSFWLTPLAELAGKTLGVVGYGRIGRKVGQIARALGMTVIASSRTRPAEDQFDDGTEWAEVEGLFAQSDVVSLHCPQTPENAGFVNQRLLARMKPTALLINTARGGLVDEADLAAALADATLAGAALDVVSAEPVDPSNALLLAPNVLLTPHMAWAAVEARRRLMRIAAGNVASFLAGRPQNVVNG